MPQTPELRAAQERMDEEARQAREFRRDLATRYLRLYETCHRPACRRARACVGPGIPACIYEQKRDYEHKLPAVRRALIAEYERMDAAAGLTGDDG